MAHQKKVDRSHWAFLQPIFVCLKASDTTVIESTRKFNFFTLTIPPENRDKALPAKHDIVETFNQQLFEGGMKKFLMTWARNPKRDKEGIPINQNVIHEKSGVRDNFVLAHWLDKSSTP
jgi:hypothetical protein